MPALHITENQSNIENIEQKMDREESTIKGFSNKR